MKGKNCKASKLGGYTIGISLVVPIVNPVKLDPAEVPTYGKPAATAAFKSLTRSNSYKVFNKRKVFPPPIKIAFACPIASF
ncbi:hypothetical protein D3C72_2107490 [compost metagenome]